MATRKQRSRRAKTFRHDYALVKYDEEGNEVEVSASELRGKSPDEREQPKAAAQSSAKPQRGVPQPPSWERAVKWGGLMGLGLALVYVVLLRQPIGAILAPMFIPIKYWSDRFTYRFYMKRQAATKKDPVQTAPGSRGRKR
jgi:hypothetical protein